MKTRKRKQNKAPSISESDLAKLSPKAQQQAREQLGKLDTAEEKATTPKQKAAVAKRRRSLIARLGTRLRLIASTKKYKVEARNLNKAPIKKIKVRARTETDAIAEAKRKLGRGFDEFKVKNPSKGVYMVSARRKKNPYMTQAEIDALPFKQRNQVENFLGLAAMGNQKGYAEKGEKGSVVVHQGSARFVVSKTGKVSTENPKRKRNRSDIHKIVRDHIRAGRNQKQILDLMKRAGFKKEMLAEARKIYNQEKTFVRKMRTGKNPTRLTDPELVLLRAAFRVKPSGRQGALMSVSEILSQSRVPWSKSKKKSVLKRLVEKGVLVGHAHAHISSLTSQQKSEMLIFKDRRGQRIYYVGLAVADPDILPAEVLVNPRRARRNISGKKIISTVKRTAVKAGKTAIGVVKGAIKGGMKATKNPKKEKLSVKIGDQIQDVYGRWHDVFRVSGDVITVAGGTIHKSKIIAVRKLEKPPSSIRSRRHRNDGASERREQFAGKVTKHIDLYIPGNVSGKGLSGLGPMVKICTDAGDFKPTAGHIYYLQDGREKLYAGSVENKPMANPNQDFGKVHRVEYECAKPHLGYPEKTIWYHDFESPLPRLKSDGDGALHFSGGGYQIKREGIVG